MTLSNPFSYLFLTIFQIKHLYSLNHVIDNKIKFLKSQNEYIEYKEQNEEQQL